MKCNFNASNGPIRGSTSRRRVLGEASTSCRRAVGEALTSLQSSRAVTAGIDYILSSKGAGGDSLGICREQAVTQNIPSVATRLTCESNLNATVTRGMLAHSGYEPSECRHIVLLLYVERLTVTHRLPRRALAEPSARPRLALGELAGQ